MVTETLGRFEIQRVLGQGGFARVFLARDPQLDRLVALKLPLPETLDDDRGRKRFEREARAAALLSHPSIVPIFETGKVGPVTYIAMGYCPGPTLAQWFAHCERKIPLDTAASIVSKLAETAEHAHQRGIVHRDLKPGNVLLEQQTSAHQDVADRIRITDFGLAWLANNRDETLTIEGSVLGTPAYMSPEQARGEGDVQPAGDLFSLGAILYELLTGQRPFKRDTHLATLRAIENEEPAPPRELNPTIPKNLESICLKCLRKEPASRYESAYHLSADLERYLRGEPVLARPVTKLERVLAWRRRNPMLAATMAVAFLAITAGLAGTTWQWRKAKANLLQAEAEVERTQQVASFLGRTYRSPSPTRDGREVKVVELLDRSVAEVNDEFANDQTMRWTLLQQIANSYKGLGLVDQELPILRLIHEEQVAANEPPGILSISILSDLADAENSAGDFATATQLIATAHQLAVQHFGANSVATTRILARQAMLFQNTGDVAKAIELYSEVVQQYEEDSEAPLNDLRTAQIDLARALRTNKDLESATDLLASIVPELDSRLGPDHPITISAKTEYVTCLKNSGIKENVVRLRREILTASRHVNGDKHPRTLQALSNLAVELSTSGQSDESISVFKEAISGSTEVFGADSPYTMISTFGFAQSLEQMGDLAAARIQYEVAYEGLRASIGGAHPRTLKVANQLAKLLTETGDEAALEELRAIVKADAQ